MDQLVGHMDKQLNCHTNGPLINENNQNEQNEDLVNPWNVCSKSQTGVDYDKLIGYYLLINYLLINCLLIDCLMNYLINCLMNCLNYLLN
jgi:hypothetical protein